MARIRIQPLELNLEFFLYVCLYRAGYTSRKKWGQIRCVDQLWLSRAARQEFQISAGDSWQEPAGAQL